MGLVTEPSDTLDLWDYRRRIHDLYRRVRGGGPGEAPWQQWRDERDRVFAHHPQSALDAAQKVGFRGLSYFPYDPAWRFEVTLEEIDAGITELERSSVGSTAARRFARARFFVGGEALMLTLFRLEGYGEGVFLPFRDASNGEETYVGGRHLLDTAKGADLGHSGNTVILDFNYAYNPSCAHNPRWSCPLAPPENRLAVAVRAGERT